MSCQSDHRFNPDLQKLQDSQAGDGSHKCAGCAYERGFWDGRAGTRNVIDPAQLDDSQAAMGRHKDPVKAYNLGYTHGEILRNAGYPHP